MSADRVYEQFPDTDASTFVQWKGTTVCIDLRCPCGRHGHYDGDFAYYLHCPGCGTVYEMGTAVLAIKTDITEADGLSVQTLE